MLVADWNLADSEQKKAVVHQAALTALSSLPFGEESSGAQWIRRIIFHKDYVAIRPEALESILERMHIGHRNNHSSLLQDAVGQLDRLAEFYAQRLFPVRKSRAGLVKKNDQILPADWIYLPLVALYQRELEKQPGQQQPDMCPEEERTVAVCSIQAAYVLVTSRPTWFFSAVKPNEHYARLACAFLAGNNLFLEPQMARYLEPVLRAIASQPLDFSRPVNGIDDFSSLYKYKVFIIFFLKLNEITIGMLQLRASHPAL